jgi:anti-anti-sigma regulatory factor
MLTAYVKRSGKSTTVALRGAIDEAAAPPLLQILPKIVVVDVIFDCAEVGTINSLGFRHWLQFLRGLAERSTFRFLNCPPAYIDYAGMLQETAFAERIVSVLVPFRCKSCGEEESSAVDVDAVIADGVDWAICPRCNGLMRSMIEAAELTRLRSTPASAT